MYLVGVMIRVVSSLMYSAYLHWTCRYCMQLNMYILPTHINPYTFNAFNCVFGPIFSIIHTLKVIPCRALKDTETHYVRAVPVQYIRSRISMYMPCIQRWVRALVFSLSMWVNPYVYTIYLYVRKGRTVSCNWSRETMRLAGMVAAAGCICVWK